MREIIEISKQERFHGHFFFLENYDIELAKKLTQGADIWLNTPEMGMEASGTSGMKAAMNGVLNFSVLDGWWGEAYNDDIGWAISSPIEGKNSIVQNEMESEILYRELENNIIPLFSNRDADDIPTNWIAKIKNSISQIGPVYTTQRILKGYIERYYIKLESRTKLISANHFECAKKLAIWKTQVINEWNKIQVISMDVFDSNNKAFPLGSELNPSIVIDIGELSLDDIGVEIIFINKRKDEDDFETIFFKNDLNPSELINRQATFSCKIPITQSGVYEHGFRIYPKNPLLLYRQDFPLVKWV